MYEDIADFTLKQLEQQGASYVEVRLEEDQTSAFSLKNGILDVSGFEENQGIGVRYLYQNTLGFFNCNVFEKARVKKLLDASLRLTKNAARRGEQIAFSREKPAKVRYAVGQKISLQQNPEWKLDKLWELDKALGQLETRTFFLQDTLSRKYFVNSEGSKIIAKIPRVNLFYFFTISRGQQSIQRFLQHGACSGYECWKQWNLLERLPEEVRALQQNLLKGVKLKPGKMDVITGPEVTGIAVHESCGHPYEADRIFGREGAQAGESFVKESDIGQRSGSSEVTIVDDPTLEQGFGHYLYDDEGVKARRKYLMKNGVITEFLHNRETAARMGMQSNGSSRAAGYDREPLIRMSNTFVLPGSWKEEEMIKDVKKGVYLKSFMEWNIDDKRWQQKYVGNEAYLIEHGEITKPVKMPVLEITTPGLWNAVDAVGRKMEYYAGTCGKGEPMSPIATWMGGPMMRLRDVHIK